MAEEEHQEEGEPADNDQVVPLKQKAGRAMRSRKRAERQAAAEDEEDEVAGNQAGSKRARVDHSEEVKQLFGA